MLLLLVIGTPIAWWLVRTRSVAEGGGRRGRRAAAGAAADGAGLYLLVAMGRGPGRLDHAGARPGLLPFTFRRAGGGLGAVLMPFVVQPLQQAFAAIDEATLEAAATLRAGPWDRFFAVVVRWRAAGLPDRGGARVCATPWASSASC